MKPNSRLSVNQLVDYGIRLAQENQPEAARRFFEKALEREPRNTAALLWLAGLSETSAEGYRLLVQTLEIDPRNERARTAIRWNYWREQGEKMRAAELAAGGAMPPDRAVGGPKQRRHSGLARNSGGFARHRRRDRLDLFWTTAARLGHCRASDHTTTQEVAQFALDATPPPLATRTLPPTSTPLPTSTPSATATPLATATLPPTLASHRYTHSAPH